jgi:DNA helicase-2/ATP-dependent DNA helicase PcrA
MKFIADLHIHSRFSRATSRDLDPEHLALWARKKGITVVGTGDFTHPGWLSELQDKLIEAEEGLYRLRPDVQQAVDRQIPPSCSGPTRFLLSGEISCIYKKGEKTRKIHHLILMPDMASVAKMNERLNRIGNITSDGRPILGLDSKDLLEITLEASERAFFIPAHIWTPWFSVFGSKSGFDGLEECFEDLTGHIHALETGLSSDPSMNRCLSALDGYILVSNSDAHSPAKLGREANLFDTDPDYPNMVRAMTNGDGLVGTVEFYPEEGKYHLDGHRKCGVRFEPEETLAHEGMCPVCGRPLTVGVLHRVHELSDRREPRLSKEVFSLIPLNEVLSELMNCGPATKKVTAFYERLLAELGPELQILMDVPLDRVEIAAGPLLAKAIGRMRQDRVIREGGYDGQYGTIRVFHPAEREALAGQMALFGAPSPPPPGPSRPARAPGKVPQKKKNSSPRPAASARDPILGHLNPEQHAAALYEGGHLLVVAGPGTGKTLTLTHRIAHLIQSGLALPEQILALTFTRKAAKEMGQRLTRLLDPDVGKRVSVSTFHGFCLDILRSDGDKTGLPRDFILCNAADAEDLKREMGIQRATERPRERFEAYTARLRDLGMLDLDDLEVEALRLFQEHPFVCKAYSEKFPWIFVDEYQDTNPLQVDFLKRLIRSGSGNLCAIGDPDQAIYGFRGADVRSFHRFQQDFPGAQVIVLNQNYRSTQEILDGSAALLHKDTPLRSESARGDHPIFLAGCRTEGEEAEMIVEQVERLMGGTSYFSLDSGRVASHEEGLSLGFGDIGILFRLNTQGDALEAALSRAGIPFVRSGEIPLIKRDPIPVLWRFFQTLQYPQNEYFGRMYAQVFPSGPEEKGERVGAFQPEGSLSDLIDKAVEFHGLDCSSPDSAEAVRRLKETARDFDGDVEGFLDTLSLERGIDHALLLGDRVALMSLHAAKGLEWPVVFITGCEDQLLPCTLFGSRDDGEERRLFYVGMTRARQRLVLSHVARRVLKGRTLDMRPSPFLKDIPGELLRPLDRRGWGPARRAHRQMELF